MYRLSAVIEEMFSKYLPVAEKRGVRFNLDFPDSTRRIGRIFTVKKLLDEHLALAIKRAQHEVSLKVLDEAISIRDDGVALSPAQIAEIQDDELIKIKSRVGFGTDVRISIS